MPDSQDPNNSLPKILNELHRALEASEDLAEEVRADLRGAADEIREALDSAATAELPSSLRERLTAALEHFEGSHPRLTSALGRMADALADLGI
jgi:ABC-type transporter Mla subunit MlaD